MPHINRHQQRALPLKGGHPNPKAQAELNKTKERLPKQIEDKEAVAEVRYWERRAWLRG